MGSESAALKEILKSKVWYYWVKGLGDPENSLISSEKEPEQDGFVNAAKVFETMGLDLEKLSQIFVEKPWGHYRNRIPVVEREKQPTAKNYLCLGKCRPQDRDGWKELSALTEKEIYLVNPDKGPEERIIAVFHSNREYEYFGGKEE